MFDLHVLGLSAVYRCYNVVDWSAYYSDRDCSQILSFQCDDSYWTGYNPVSHCCLCRALPQSDHTQPYRYWNIDYANTLSSWPESSASLTWGPDNIAIDTAELRVGGVSGKLEAYVDLTTSAIETTVFRLDLDVQDDPRSRSRKALLLSIQTKFGTPFAFQCFCDCPDRWC